MMPLVSEFAVRFALGSLYSLGISAIVCLVAVLISARVPWLQSARMYWLLALLCCAAALPASLLPSSATPESVGHAPVVSVILDDSATRTASPGVTYSAGLAEQMAQAWLVVFVAVALLMCALHMRAALRLRRLLAATVPCDSAQHPAVAQALSLALPGRRLRTLVCAQSHSPFIAGVFRPVLVIPARLADVLSQAQIRMAVRHECAHVAANDPLMLSALRWLGALFWFNPFMHVLVQRFRLSAEIACDEFAMSGSVAGRHVYAEALVRIARWSQRRPQPSVVGGPVTWADSSRRDLRTRMLRIAAPPQLPAGRWRWHMAVVLCAVVCLGVSIGLRPQVFAASALVSNWNTPLNVPWKVSSRFGTIRSVTAQNFHAGVDIVAPLGSDVLAASDGTVIAVSDSGDSGYGISVLVEHADALQTRYANLQSTHVLAGQRVKRGEAIAQLGSSGNSTGPHLHFELLKGGKPMDPAIILSSQVVP